MRACQFWREPPWVILHQHKAWVTMANMVMEAESHAQQMRQRRDR